MIRTLTLLVLTLAWTPTLLAQSDAESQKQMVETATRLFDDLREETLPNGLRVYLLPIPSSPVVTTMVAYKVGASDEEKSQTGLSHYLEHLLFKGTAKLNPGDIDRATQRSGGSNNAYTNEDMTVYHFDFAADRWKQALEIEADRMRNVLIDEKHEFQQEKGAVIAELKGGEDRPWDLEYKSILPRLYPAKSPYAHPVIGEETHVRAATAEIIARHYNMWYHPNNAALVIAGDFDPDDALATVKALFGKIPSSELPQRKPYLPREKVTEQVRYEFESKFDVSRLMVGFNTIPVTDPDDPVLDLVSAILSDGKTARLYKKLVKEERLAGSVNAGNNSGRYPGWFAVTIEMLQGKDRQAAEKMLFAELDRLTREPVTAAELERAKRSTIAGFVFSGESAHSLADLVSRNAMYGDVNRLKTYLPDVLKVTPEDIQRVAKKFFKPEAAVVVWSVPSAEMTQAQPAAPSENESPINVELEDAKKSFSLTNAKREVLDNGLTLIMLENHTLPVVVAQARIDGVQLIEPAAKAGVATLLGAMLDEGTSARTSEEIAKLIENTGGSLSFSSNGASMKMLTPDAALGFDLMFDGLLHPSFPPENLSRTREQLLSLISEAESQPQVKAKATFDKLVYGLHPYGRPSYGSSAVMKTLTADDLKAFHEQAFTPDNMVLVVVGDFDPMAVKKQVEALTKDWTAQGATKTKLAEPPTRDKPIVKIIPDATAAQTHVFIGQLGITRNNPDYYKLLVMDNVLGTGPGFTDRLSANLRDRQGLAYTVRATIASDAGKEPGTFTGYIGTFPDKFTTVRVGFMNEINRIRDEKPSLEEVESAKQYLLGSMPFKLTTNSQVASQLMQAELYGLGFDFFDEFRTKVAAVTPEDVQAVAQKYLDPAKMVLVAVGPIDETGQPLPTSKE